MNLATYRVEIAQAMTEAELQDAIINPGDKNGRNHGLAVVHGWLVYHTRDSRGSHKGFPDLTLIRNGYVIFAELKKETGKATPDQVRWLEELAQAEKESAGKVRAFLWRPSDLIEGRIEDVLR